MAKAEGRGSGHGSRSRRDRERSSGDGDDTALSLEQYLAARYGITYLVGGTKIDIDVKRWFHFPQAPKVMEAGSKKAPAGHHHQGDES